MWAVNASCICQRLQKQKQRHKSCGFPQFSYYLCVVICSEIKLGNKFSFFENHSFRFPASLPPSVRVVVKKSQVKSIPFLSFFPEFFCFLFTPTKKDHITQINILDINFVPQLTQHNNSAQLFMFPSVFSGPPKLHFCFVTQICFF